MRRLTYPDVCPKHVQKFGTERILGLLVNINQIYTCTERRPWYEMSKDSREGDGKRLGVMELGCVKGVKRIHFPG